MGKSARFSAAFEAEHHRHPYPGVDRFVGAACWDELPAPDRVHRGAIERFVSARRFDLHLPGRARRSHQHFECDSSLDPIASCPAWILRRRVPEILGTQSRRGRWRNGNFLRRHRCHGQYRRGVWLFPTPCPFSWKRIRGWTRIGDWRRPRNRRGRELFRDRRRRPSHGDRNARCFRRRCRNRVLGKHGFLCAPRIRCGQPDAVERRAVFMSHRRTISRDAQADVDRQRRCDGSRHDRRHQSDGGGVDSQARGDAGDDEPRLAPVKWISKHAEVANGSNPCTWAPGASHQGAACRPAIRHTASA
jgi:hypothetical protein